MLRAFMAEGAIAEIGAALRAYSPVLSARKNPRRAAVAVVLRLHGGAPEVLLIHRAVHKGDPWSGHMAFPGGRVEARDASPEFAARRETQEEVGLSLAGAQGLGRIDDLEGHAHSLVVSAYVFYARRPGALRPQPAEVQSAFFFPLWELANPARHVRRAFRDAGGYQLPGVVVGDAQQHVVWGLTYRFIEILYAALGRGFPAGAAGVSPDEAAAAATALDPVWRQRAAAASAKAAQASTGSRG